MQERIARRFLKVDLSAPPSGRGSDSDDIDSASLIRSDILGDFAEFSEIMSNAS